MGDFTRTDVVLLSHYGGCGSRFNNLYSKAQKQDKWFGIALALMLGGAIGNFIDRVVRKEVVDFVNTYIFTYDFPIFNVADSALVVGVIIMFIMTLFEGKMKKEHKE